MGLKNFLWWLECRKLFSRYAYDKACGSFEEVTLDSNAINFPQKSVLIIGVEEPIAQYTAIDLAKKGI